MKFRKIIESILLELGYQKSCPCEQIDFYERNIDGYSNMYIVTDSEDLLEEDFDFQQYQAKTYESITNKPLGFDKNTSWIIGTCIGKNVNLDNLLLIEEDQYYFRKLVLYYSREELESYLSEVSSKAQKLNELNSIIMNSEKYEMYIKDKGNNPLYSFIIKLFVKIPSIIISDTIQEEIVNINGKIESKISEKGLIMELSCLRKNPDIINEIINGVNVDENITKFLDAFNEN